ncbi:hypothetical protein HID58_051821, partial [Brassica napus]
ESVDLITFLSSPPISFLSSMVIHCSSSGKTHSLISMFLLFYFFFSFYPNFFFTLYFFSSLPSTCINGDLGHNQQKRKKGSKQNESKQISRKSKVVPASDASAELLASIQKRQGENNQTSMSEKFNPNEDAALKSVMMRGLNWSPPLSKELSFVQRESAQLTKFSDSLAARHASHFSIANQRWFNNKKMVMGHHIFWLNPKILQKRKNPP